MCIGACINARIAKMYYGMDAVDGGVYALNLPTAPGHIAARIGNRTKKSAWSYHLSAYAMKWPAQHNRRSMPLLAAMLNASFAMLPVTNH